MSAPRRSAFSLLQLLVLLALLILAAAIGVPALVKARQREKTANLTQLALGALNYESANGFFPPGVDAQQFSAGAYLLPYVEQDNVYNLIDFKKPIADEKNAQVAKTRVVVFLSPLDPQASVSKDLGATNYLFSAGSKPSLTGNDGIFYKNSKTRIADITDGTSNTMAIGETLKGDGGKAAVDVKRQHIQLGENALPGLTDDAGAQDWKDGKHIAGNRCASWMDGRLLQGTFTATRLPNDSKPDVSCDGLGGLTALRSLGDVVHVGMCDGSVRTIRMNIDKKVWQALATRNGGEAVAIDF